MKVTELSQDQLDELKANYYYGEDEDDGHEAEYDCPDDVPNEVIYKHFENFEFESDHFWFLMDEDDYHRRFYQLSCGLSALTIH